MIPERSRDIAALVMVPLVLIAADLAANGTALKFLLLPPFGALTYLVFVNPANVGLNARRIIVAPTGAALIAWIIANTLGYNAVSVAVATIGTMVLMFALDARMIVPPMALALLTLLLHNEVRGRIGYIVSVLIFTVVIYALYRLWRWVLAEREHSESDQETGGSTCTTPR